MGYGDCTMMKTQFDFIDAVTSLYVDRINWCSSDGGISWKDGHETTAQELEAVQVELARLQAEYKATEYQRQRAQAYPSMADQLDTIYHEGIDAWKAQIAAVKQEYPKP
jgi:hypothetical protein